VKINERSEKQQVTSIMFISVRYILSKILLLVHLFKKLKLKLNMVYLHNQQLKNPVFIEFSVKPRESELHILNNELILSGSLARLSEMVVYKLYIWS
jgi:hypothetical protein